VLLQPPRPCLLLFLFLVLPLPRRREGTLAGDHHLQQFFLRYSAQILLLLLLFLFLMLL
jgi:hypothetical protein